MVTTSPAATVTIAGEPVSLFIDVPTLTPSSLPYTGGTVTVSGTTNEPAGSVLTILVNGGVSGTATVSGTTYSGTVSIAPNDTASAVTDTITLEGP